MKNPKKDFKEAEDLYDDSKKILDTLLIPYTHKDITLMAAYLLDIYKMGWDDRTMVM